MDDLLSEFLTETSENLSVLDLELVKLEQNPNDHELLSNIFRLVHTVKGTCGFLGLPRLEAVAHAGENILGRLRDGELVATSEAVTLILECLDRIRSIMGDLEAQQKEPEGEDKELIGRLNALANQASGSSNAPVSVSAPVQAPTDATSSVSASGATSPTSGMSLYEQMGGMGTIDAVVEILFRRVLADLRLKHFFEKAPMDHLQEKMRDYLAAMTGGPSLGAADLVPVHARLLPMGLNDGHFDAFAGHMQAALHALDVSAPVAAMITGLVFSLRDKLVDSAGKPALSVSEPAASAIPVPAAVATAKPADNPEPKEKDSAIANQTIRVNVELLENLMTMVSELVLTRNQVLQILRTQKDSEFTGPLQRLNHVTSELQEGVMKTRMQPIGNAWSKLPRLVRDLSQDLKKKIDLVMIGQDTELDRQILEMIKDPLTHMVRNSCDHAMELPEERRKVSKPETGKITLNAYHEGGHIIIEISDDGRGLNREKIRAKILQNNLSTEAELDQMTDQQINQFIFKPGFSTAAKVTSVSGRGVGMDVVKTNIDRIGGTIELRSVEGKGTTFMVKIPLTLAIVSALIVECAGERFAIPQISVVELVRATAGGDLRVEKIKDTPVLRLRNRLLPLVSLRSLLQLEESGAPSEDTFIVVTQVGTYSFGIMVDRVFDTEEIVVKPVAPILRHIDMFSGNTILGDGSVIMILDLNGIAAASGQTGASDLELENKDIARHMSHGDEPVPLLIFRGGEGAPKAVPLALIARLEEFERKQIENSNGRLVVQYRGCLMPLVPLYPGQEHMERSTRQPVLVFSDREHTMGLIVDEIIDIIEARLTIQLSAEIPGRVGSAIINGQATDVIDTGYYLAQAFPNWFGSSQEEHDAVTQRRLLLVDDSAFFRNLLAPQLSAAGFQVTAVDGPERALSLAEAGEQFDVIVSDIEMPGMDGFSFCEAVKRHSQWHAVPVLALSSRASPKDLAKGRDAGFQDYIAKYDREGLVHSLKDVLADSRSAA